VANAFSFLWDDSAAKADLVKIEREANRATAWAVRQVGRVVKREMQAECPVYAGPPDPHTPKGRLRKSIKTGRSIGNIGGVLTNKVGSRGFPAQTYAGKWDTSYVAVGRATAEASAPMIFEQAVARAIARYSA
jgi:hypothetical protein